VSKRWISVVNCCGLLWRNIIESLPGQLWVFMYFQSALEALHKKRRSHVLSVCLAAPLSGSVPVWVYGRSASSYGVRPHRSTPHPLSVYVELMTSTNYNEAIVTDSLTELEQFGCRIRIS
jgi:hypothetical protein